jgi:ubiquinone/menaquinone biosynthesis C-methylase UbiE
MPDTPVVDLDALDDDGRYLTYHAARDEGAEGYAEHRRDVRTLLGLEAGARVVEVGCGTGAHLPHLSDLVGANGYVLGVDSSQKMLNLAESRLGAAGVQPLEAGASRNGVSLLHARLDSMPSELGEFDVVLADRLIGHLSDPCLGLEQLGGLCRSGGRVVVVNMLNSATVVNLGAGADERELAQRVLTWRAERGTSSAWAAPVLSSLAIRVGLTPVSVRYWVFPCKSLEETYPHSPLIEYGDHAVADGALDNSEAKRWRELLEAADRDGVFSALFVVRADVLLVP